jgi:putative PIN family toxin of toxin-antitoxin system
MIEETSRPRVVFDCMIYLQATINEFGPAATLLRLVDDEAFSLLTSNEILEEVREVLLRPKIRERNLDLTGERVDAFINHVREKGIVLDDVQQHFIYSRDPKDEKYINLAVEADADYVISRDYDLLDLMTGYTDECKEFRRKFRQLKIIAPVEFLKIVRSEESGKP